MPSMVKRLASVSLTNCDSIYDRAKRLLADIGAPLSICPLVCDLLETVGDESLSYSTRPITLREAFFGFDLDEEQSQNVLV